MYDQMLADQKGRCAICRAPPALGKRLCVDHDHRTKFIRGLVCDLHNRGLGHFGDDRDRLGQAIEYLHDAATREMIAGAEFAGAGAL